MRTSFPREVAEAIGIYVYRLVDPRSGETFYVGKGKGDRVFQHALGALVHSEDDPVDLKTKRIKLILDDGLEVIPIIHRHKIDNDSVAFQIEGALIDAYPGLSNVSGGHGNGDYGVRHVEQIVTEYQEGEFVAEEPLILIKLGKSYRDNGQCLYEAVRGVWKISPSKANQRKLVLASSLGIIRGAFTPTGPWIPATRDNFPVLEEDVDGRWGFVGVPAEPEVANRYINRRVPDRFRMKGASNPVRFVEPDAAA